MKDNDLDNLTKEGFEDLQDELWNEYPNEIDFVIARLHRRTGKDPRPTLVVRRFTDTYPNLWKKFVRPIKHHSIDVSSTKNATLTHDLTHSKLEEGIAIRSYRERTDEAKKLGDAKTAKLYEEVIRDEKQHEEQFRRRLNQI